MPNSPGVTVNATDTLERSLAELTTQAEQINAQLAQLTAAVRAKGTREIKPMSTKDALYLRIQGLITEHPRRFSELKAATRAEDNAIKSVLIRLQRDMKTCVNLGNKHKALWAIVSEEFLAKLRG